MIDVLHDLFFNKTVGSMPAPSILGHTRLPSATVGYLHGPPSTAWFGMAGLETPESRGVFGDRSVDLGFQIAVPGV